MNARSQCFYRYLVLFFSKVRNPCFSVELPNYSLLFLCSVTSFFFLCTFKLPTQKNKLSASQRLFFFSSRIRTGLECRYARLCKTSWLSSRLILKPRHHPKARASRSPRSCSKKDKCSCKLSSMCKTRLNRTSQ